jgi:hypothetical protein
MSAQTDPFPPKLFPGHSIFGFAEFIYEDTAILIAIHWINFASQRSIVVDLAGFTIIRHKRASSFDIPEARQAIMSNITYLLSFESNRYQTEDVILGELHHSLFATITTSRASHIFCPLDFKPVLVKGIKRPP